MENSFTRLPDDWKVWVKENLARGCTTTSMAETMVRDGGFSRAVAVAAIAAAQGQAGAKTTAHTTVQPMPDIDTSINTVRTPDRDVHVLMSAQTPRVVLLGNVVGDEECDELCAYIDQRLTRSPVVGDTDGGTQLNAQRTSFGAMLQRGETELIARIETRLAAIARWPVENGEGLQVLRYQKGNEYRPHYDWFDPEMPGPRKHLENGGQRVGTFVIYLSDVVDGGGTSFPGSGLEVQPRRGNAVFFRNTDDYGAPDRNSLHAGSPVITGTKFIATKWLRERKY
jgi:prolyl 4-hydroxylase